MARKSGEIMAKDIRVSKKKRTVIGVSIAVIALIVAALIALSIQSCWRIRNESNKYQNGIFA